MSLPNKDEIKGKLNQAKGTVKEKLGRASGDTVVEAEGADERVSGDLQSGFGEARRKTGDAIKDLGKKIGR